MSCILWEILIPGLAGPCRNSWRAALALCLALAAPASQAERSVLEPIDLSSPRTTLQGFIEFSNEAYDLGVRRLHEFLASNQRFPSGSDMSTFRAGIRRLQAAERALDLSEVPPAIREESSRRLTMMLKEVLDRVALPAWDSVPDARAMADTEPKRWTVPGTEIRISRVEQGPRRGEYLFDPETVERLPEFYEQVRELPYQEGRTGNLYEVSTYSPMGLAMLLHDIVPPRWLLKLPDWATEIRVLDQPLWRWAAILLMLAAGFLAVRRCFKLSEDMQNLVNPARRGWAELLKPLSLAVVAPLTAGLMADVLRVTGSVYAVTTLGLWGLFFIALTWSVWVAGGAIAESIVGVERLRASSIDSQLVRLILRLLTIILAIAVLVVGADRVGLPAYSVVAGLGVGGLAVALAAQQTLANLLGSLIIMFEKPFSIGHSIRAQGVEGTVESVGFRSTRIRTAQNSVVSIPSSQLVNANIDNMQLRKYRQVVTTLNLTNDTSPPKIQAFLEAIEQILRHHPDTRKDDLQVALHDIGTGGPDIRVNFFLEVPNQSAELAARQAIFMAILETADAAGIQFR